VIYCLHTFGYVLDWYVMIELSYQLKDSNGVAVGETRVIPFYGNRRKAEAYRDKILKKFPKSLIAWSE